MSDEIMNMVKEAMDLSNAMEESLEGKDLYVILMALTKVAGVMLAEAREIMPDTPDEESAARWFSQGMIAAYRGHMAVMQEISQKMH